MSDEGGGGTQLAQWLKEAGRRTPSRPGASDERRDETYNSPASLHHYLEKLAGRKLETHAEVLRYLREVAGTQPGAHRERERRRMLREATLLALLTVSYLHYYFWEVQLQIVSLHTVSVFIPASEARPFRRSI